MKLQHLTIYLSLPLLLIGGANAQGVVGPGSLIQKQGSKAVYYIGSDNKRYTFPNDKIYFSWYEDFSEVVVVTDEEYAKHPLGGNVKYRAGTRLIKIESDPRVYAVEPGGILRWVSTEEIAQGLYSDVWNTIIDDIPVVYFADYEFGDDITTIEYPLGTLVKYLDSSDRFMIDYENDQIVKRKFTSFGFSGNRFREEFLQTADPAITYSDGTDITGVDSSIIDPLRQPLRTASKEQIPSEQEPEPVVLNSPAKFVDATVEVSGDGSIDKPFKTIAQGLAAIILGDTLYIRGEKEGGGRVYQENPVFIKNGTQQKPFTIAAYPGEKALVLHSNTLEFSADWWRVQDIVFDHQNAPTDAIQITGSSIVFDGIEVSNGQADGIEVMSTVNDILVDNSTIHDFSDGLNTARCIALNTKLNRIIIRSSTLYNCGTDSIQMNAKVGTRLEDFSRDIDIVGNTLYAAVNSTNRSALDVSGVDDLMVSKNTIYGFDGVAVEIRRGSRNITFSHNRVHDSDRGIEVRSEGSDTPNTIGIVNNLIYDITGLYAMRFGGVDGLRVVNNTLASIAGSAINVDDVGIKSGSIRNNLTSNAGANSINSTKQKATVSHNGWFNGATQSGLTGDNDITGIDAKFVASVNNDYHLLADSPAIDKGAAQTFVTDDFDGITRPQGKEYDLGAFEFKN